VEALTNVGEEVKFRWKGKRKNSAEGTTGLSFTEKETHLHGNKRGLVNNVGLV